MSKILIALLVVFNITKINANSFDQHRVNKFIAEMVSQHNFDKNDIENIINEAKLQDNIITSMNRPYESRAWYVYKNTFVSKNRIILGVEFWQKHKESLDRAEKKYNVPAEIIVAIIGAESNYGKFQGNHRVLDALSTLAFAYPRRADYFQRELVQFLLLTRENNMNPLDIYGSYAGAMGKAQFMPSSYRHYAVDFSGTGVSDLRTDPIDAIGSVANYFNKHGWIKNDLVVSKVKNVDNINNININSRLPNYRITELKNKGVDVADYLNDDVKATFITLDSKYNEEYWLGFHNFYVITRYNNSKHYAMAIHQLSQAIANEFNNRA